MSKRGQRLREFEKNNRIFNIEEARKKREENHRDYRERKAAEEKSKAGDCSRKKRPKKKKRIADMRRFIMATVLLICVFSAVLSLIKIVNLRSELNHLQEINGQLLEMKEDLLEETQMIDSKEYIEQQARKELKMIKDNELLFIISEEEDRE